MTQNFNNPFVFLMSGRNIFMDSEMKILANPSTVPEKRYSTVYGTHQD